MIDTFPFSQKICQEDRNTVAIVVVGYNRLNALQRLLRSLLAADYFSEHPPLVISIDCSENEELYRYVREFEWPYGRKYLRIQQERLGLKNHILSCGDLTSYFKGVILLEDDLFVSTDFYHYSCAALDYYNEEQRVAGISLYAHEMNGYVGLPFFPLNNGCDVYAVQAVSSWGECWNARMWSAFRDWFAQIGEENLDFRNLDVPETMKQWKQAWSKFFNAYLIATNRLFIYPYVSLSTNFSDAGEHGCADDAVVQVSLQCGRRNYDMRSIDQLVTYDIFSNNISLYSALGLSKEDLCLDVYADRGNPYKCRYWLTPKKLPYKRVKSYAMSCRPIELNVLYNIQGEKLHLYDTSNTASHSDRTSWQKVLAQYYLRSFRRVYLWRALVNIYYQILKRKLLI